MSRREGEVIAPMRVSDIKEMAASFERIGWKGKGLSHFKAYQHEHDNGTRTVFVARDNGIFAGYVTVRWCSTYQPFAEKGIPEVSDLNVLPHYRQRGIGSLLMDTAERVIAARSDIVGIAVGLHKDYGTAQRLYVKRGYVPDGRGITAHGSQLAYCENATADDDLVLWFTKTLPRSS